MKRRYNITVDPEPFERVRKFLKGKGITPSAYINSTICEYDRIISGMKLPEDMKDLTLGDILEMANRISKDMKDETL